MTIPYHRGVLVTTIIPVYNRPAKLQEAVASVLAQTYRPIEIVIVDDGSTDDTAAVATALAAEHPEIRVLHQSNGGPGAARETGRQTARGAFIQHLDSDDVLLPRKFELQVAGLTAHPECGASYGWTRFRRRDGSVVPEPWKRSGERIATMFPAMLQSRWWDTPNPLYRASLLGPWTNLRIEEDWEYDARIAAHGVKLHYVEAWVCEVREHGDARVSGQGHSPATLRDRAHAHALILEHARRAGIAADAPEMQYYARELFLLARQCGAAGLAEESARLFSLARDASINANSRQFRLYALAAKLLGWRAAGKLADWRDSLRW
ncbi:MAG TPA: glycosyltransferase family A protein [Thermoanaerobaculia bacterium]